MTESHVMGMAERMELKKIEARRELAKRELSRRKLIPFVKQQFYEYETNWHHQLIADALEAVEDGKINRLMIFMPPRHGKSELCTVQFPAWYLGKNPRRQVISVSYSADLSMEFGRKVRNIVGSQEYAQIFPRSQLSNSSKATDHWQTQLGGSYTATGIGGSVTGKGAHCFPAGTPVWTPFGEYPIETLHNGERVLSYSYDRDILEYQSIVATRRIIKERFATVTTLGGHQITGTVDHPVFVVGKGYVKIQDLKVGDKVWIYQGGEIRDSKVFVMLQGIRTHLVRIYQAYTSWAQRCVLFCWLFRGSSRRKKQAEVREVLSSDYAKDGSKVSPRMSFLGTSVEENFLHAVRQTDGPIQSSNKVLRSGLQESVSRQSNAGGGEFQLSSRDGNEELSTGVLSLPCTDYHQRRGEVCGVWEIGQTLRSSQRQEPKKQRSREFNNGLYGLSHGSPQLKQDTISSITSFDKRMDAYDIQVGDNANFFANGILVSNCLIIDDPIKSRKDADSPTIREIAWKWYRGTAYTRLAPSGAIILVQTRWHDDDLAGRILNQPSGSKWHILELPAIATKDEMFNNEFMRKKGTALWPTRYSLQALESIKQSIGPYEWSSQYQQNPVDEEAVEFLKEWFKDRPAEEVDKLSTLRYLTVDTAGRGTETSNYTGFTDNRVDREGKWNVIARKYKMDFGQLANYLFVLQEKNNYEIIGIEKTIYTDALEPYLEEKMLEKGITLPIKLLEHGGRSKELRIRGLLPYYKSGRIYHVTGECEELVTQLIRFPKGAEDDIIDSLAYQLQIAKAPYGWEDKDFVRKGGEEDKSKKNQDFDKHNPIGELDI